MKSKDKIYFLYEFEVDCIFKGKVWVCYEFGIKVSFVMIIDEGFVVGVCSFVGNFYDGYILVFVLE